MVRCCMKSNQIQSLNRKNNSVLEKNCQSNKISANSKGFIQQFSFMKIPNYSKNPNNFGNKGGG